MTKQIPTDPAELAAELNSPAGVDLLREIFSSSRARGRAARRQAITDRVADLRAWREDRIHAAEKARVERRDAAAKAHEEAVAAGQKPRGVDRVPEARRDNPDRLVYVETPSVGIYRGVAANYADRRAMGQRGKPRKPRRRELAGAVERRLERARQEWTS